VWKRLGELLPCAMTHACQGTNKRKVKRATQTARIAGPNRGDGNERVFQGSKGQKNDLSKTTT